MEKKGDGFTRHCWQLQRGERGKHATNLRSTFLGSKSRLYAFVTAENREKMKEKWMMMGEGGIPPLAFSSLPPLVLVFCINTYKALSSVCSRFVDLSFLDS